MKKKGKTKQEILFEAKTKPFLNDYSKEKPAKDEGPFYMEERTLIDVIAKFLGEMIELKLAKKMDMSGR
jgi:hypothetical protein